MFVPLWIRGEQWVARAAASPAVTSEGGGRLPARMAWPAWAIALTCFLASYLWIFCFVHVRADTTACQLRLDDPLYSLIPDDPRWDLVTHTAYVFLTLSSVGALLLQAALGDHRPILRFGMGLAIMAVLRGTCILLVPLCRITSEPGTAALSAVPTLDLGFVSIPWRMWAANDMLFSGHVGEFLLLLRLTPSWPRWPRWVIGVFSVLQIYGLLATRGHYTVDIILAFPCAYFADRMAVHVLAFVAGRAASPVAISALEAPR
jgi:hypothetical protein